MGVVIFDDVTITVEASLSSATGTCGIWDTGLWGTALWGPDQTWTDVSDYVRSIKTSRRFSRDLQVWQAGTATVVLDNRDGRFSSDNLDGPYVVGGISSVRPRRPIRITATYGGITYPIYYGYASKWAEGWAKAPAGQGDAIVTVPCVDRWGLLSRVDGMAVAAQGASELFGPRLHRILDAAGHTGPRDIDPGTVTMQATTLASRPVTEMQLVAESEGGAVWVGPDDTVIGRRQYAIVEDTRSATSQVTFGDGVGEIPYLDVQPDEDDTLLCNYAAYTRVGGTAQVISDPISIALYAQVARDVRTDFVCETDAQAQELAYWKVARYKDIERLIKQVTVSPRRTDTPYATILGLRERDLVTIKRQHPGGHTVTRYCHISGISHEITKKPSRWRTTYDLWSATVLRQFANSRWDTGLWGASDTDPDAAKWFY